MYREAMRSWTEHENTFRTDALQVSQTHRRVADFKHLRLTIEILTFSLGCKNSKSTSLLTSNMVRDSFCTEISCLLNFGHFTCPETNVIYLLQI